MPSARRRGPCPYGRARGGGTLVGETLSSLCAHQRAPAPVWRTRVHRGAGAHPVHPEWGANTQLPFGKPHSRPGGDPRGFWNAEVLDLAWPAGWVAASRPRLGEGERDSPQEHSRGSPGLAAWRDPVARRRALRPPNPGPARGPTRFRVVAGAGPGGLEVTAARHGAREPAPGPAPRPRPVPFNGAAPWCGGLSGGPAQRKS